MIDLRGMWVNKNPDGTMERTLRDSYQVYNIQLWYNDGDECCYIHENLGADIYAEDVAKVFLEAANNPWRKYPEEKPTEVANYIVCLKVRGRKIMWDMMAWGGLGWLNPHPNETEVIAWKNGPELPNA